MEENSDVLKEKLYSLCFGGDLVGLKDLLKFYPVFGEDVLCKMILKSLVQNKNVIFKYLVKEFSKELNLESVFEIMEHLFNYNLESYIPILLNKKPEVINHKNSVGYTLLHLACKHYKDSKQMVLYLLSRGARLEKCKEGKYAYDLLMPFNQKIKDLCERINASFSINNVSKIPYQQIEPNLILENEIGRGMFGSVYKGKIYGETEVAIKKIVMKEVSCKEKIENEIGILNIARHSNICTLMGRSIYEDKYFILMEYVDGVSLHEKILSKELDLKKIALISKQIACAMNFLHSQKIYILHRDLKSNNILVSRQGIVKICDFG